MAADTNSGRTFDDLYYLPQEVLSQIRRDMTGDIPAYLDSVTRIRLFVSDIVPDFSFLMMEKCHTILRRLPRHRASSQSCPEEAEEISAASVTSCLQNVSTCIDLGEDQHTLTRVSGRGNSMEMKVRSDILVT